MDISSEEAIVVLFPDGVRCLKAQDLVFHEEESEDGSPSRQSMGKLTPGNSHGELSLIYNTRLGATLKARENSVLYVISRIDFKAVFKTAEREVEEFAKLLDEVHMLSPLLISQRFEVARNATGRASFAPGERALHQGKPRLAGAQWYIVEEGEAEVSREVPDGPPEKLGTLQRGGHFGEWSLLRGEASAAVNVDAGPHGLRCVLIDGDILKGLDLANQNGEVFGLPRLDMDARDYELQKNKRGAKRDTLQLAGQERQLCTLTAVKVLGRGGFGKVTLQIDPCSGERYALKQMSKGKIAEQDMTRRIAAEREIMSLMDSAFVARFYRSFRDDQYVYMLLEAVLGGNLLDVRHQNPELFRSDRPRTSSTAFYVGCIVAALEHLHSHSIVYRDLKPENVLLDDQGYAKLCDLGFARFCFKKASTFLGTPQYMAPEMIDVPHKHDMKVDWWSLGVMTFELIAGRLPWTEPNTEDVHVLVQEFRRQQDAGLSYDIFPRDCSGPVRDFIERLTRVSPGSRLGSSRDAEEVREHAWFKAAKLDFEALHERRLRAPYEPRISVPERPLPKDDFGLVGEDEDLFAVYEDDGTSWDAHF